MFVKQIENGLELKEIAKSIEAVYDTSLGPKEAIPLHYHPDFEEIYYVLSGYGLMTIGEERQEISRGDVVYIPVLSPHMLLNTAEIALRFITVAAKAAHDEK